MRLFLLLAGLTASVVAAPQARSVDNSAGTLSGTALVHDGICHSISLPEGPIEVDAAKGAVCLFYDNESCYDTPSALASGPLSSEIDPAKVGPIRAYLCSRATPVTGNTAEGQQEATAPETGSLVTDIERASPPPSSAGPSPSSLSKRDWRPGGVIFCKSPNLSGGCAFYGYDKAWLNCASAWPLSKSSSSLIVFTPWTCNMFYGDHCQRVPGEFFNVEARGSGGATVIYNLYNLSNWIASLDCWSYY